MSNEKIKGGNEENLSQAYNRATGSPDFLVYLGECFQSANLQVAIDEDQKKAQEVGQKLQQLMNKRCHSGWRGIFNLFSSDCRQVKKAMGALEKWEQAEPARAQMKCVVEMDKKNRE